MGSNFIKKNNFQFVFHNLGGNFSSFRRAISSTVVRTALVSRFFNLICAIFFGVHANFYRLVCRNCILRVHRIAILGSIFFGKKNTFQIIFRILDGNLPSFRYYFSSTVTRTALVSRFLIGFLPIISDFTQNSLGWSVGTALYVTTRSFLWEAPSLKKTLFKLYFAFWIETFQLFGETFPVR